MNKSFWKGGPGRKPLFRAAAARRGRSRLADGDGGAKTPPPKKTQESSRPAPRPALRIGWRLALWFSLVTICITLTIFAATYALVSHAIRENNRKVALNKLGQYVQIESTHGLNALLRILNLESQANEQTGFFVRVLDDHNNTLLLTLPEGLHDIDPRQIQARRFTATRRWVVLQPSEDGETLEAMGMTLSKDFQLQVGFGMAERKRLLGYVKSIFPLAALPMLLFGLGGGVFLANRALAPLRDLSRAVARVEAGGFDARVPMPLSQDELHDLAAQFNTMLERIETLIAGMRDTLDNVAHDLRTPLMRLRLSVEQALQQDVGPEALREALQDCAEEAERINRMLTSFMDISEAESGAMVLQREQTALGALAAEVCELYQMLAEEKQIELTLQGGEDVHALVDPDRIRQVLANLLDNALKYTSEKGRVDVRVSTRKDKNEQSAVIQVQDNGPGIPSEDLPHIFDRLFRGDKSRSKKGLGLGLSLVRAVVQAHGGRIEVRSAPNEGSTFSVLLPLT